MDVLLFSGEGVKEYCVEGRNSDESLVEAVGSGSVCEVDDAI